jgi:putative oxidoreductase
MYRRFSSHEQVVPLLLRVGIGLVFFVSGLGKLMGGIAGVSMFFGKLGIPLPGVAAPLITFLEMLGGLAIMLGLFTRPISVLLICDMLVAILMAKLPMAMAAKTFSDSFNAIRLELLLALSSAALALGGAGLYSLDAKLFGEQEASRDARGPIADRPVLQ